MERDEGKSDGDESDGKGREGKPDRGGRQRPRECLKSTSYTDLLVM